MKNRYAKAEVNVQKITTSLQDHQMRLMKDSAVLEKMYAQNLNYYKELTMYILAGKQKLQEVREGKLKDLEAKAAVSGLPVSYTHLLANLIVAVTKAMASGVRLNEVLDTQPSLTDQGNSCLLYTSRCV